MNTNTALTFTLGRSTRRRVTYKASGIGSLRFSPSMFAGFGTEGFTLPATITIADGSVFIAPKATRVAKDVDPAKVIAAAEKAEARAKKATDRAAKLLEQVNRIKASLASQTPAEPATEQVPAEQEQVQDQPESTPEPEPVVAQADPKASRRGRK